MRNRASVTSSKASPSGGGGGRIQGGGGALPAGTPTNTSFVAHSGANADTMAQYPADDGSFRQLQGLEQARDKVDGVLTWEGFSMWLSSSHVVAYSEGYH